MIVTDITRMEGARVCVGGYLDDGTSVRPVAGRGGPDVRWLRSARDAPVVPFAVVGLHVNRAPKQRLAPHTEDRTVPANGHRVLKVLDDAEQVALLERSLSPAVRAVFGAEIHADVNGQWGRYVRSGEGSRSLGTIRAGSIQSVHYRFYPERKRWDYRLRFVDEAGEAFQLAVVDLAFRDRLDRLRGSGSTPKEAARATLDELRPQAVYLRIGLARGWDKHPDRCYLQITGVYGFSRSVRR